MFPADAEGRFEGVGRVVYPRVDDLAVAGGRFGADGGVAFQQEGRGVWAGCEAVGRCEAYCAAADDLGVLVQLLFEIRCCEVVSVVVRFDIGKLKGPGNSLRG